MKYEVIITDTSCFIILQKIQALFILNELFTSVVTTPQIAEEYNFELPGWVLVREVKDVALVNEISRYIDYGEASAIALAKEIDCKYLILDDNEARKYAEKPGFIVKGSVGLLLMAKQTGIIKNVKPFLSLIQETNFRISVPIIQKILKAAGEQ